ncbi:MAG: HD domain-containing protein [Opitutae bacterium]|nr:HD domain-containing protein [Opitutae bacterium]
MALPHAINTKEPAAVCSYVQSIFVSEGWMSSVPLIGHLVEDVTSMFTGHYLGYQANDMRYHNFEHTLQATLCMADLIKGRHVAHAEPALSRRDAELCIMAVMLHDVGFIKRTSDRAGTGAKYTFVHERRSCDFARLYLPALGISPAEMEDICTAISCTGPRNRVSAQTFRRIEARIMACCLVTADYLAQMSSPDYPDKLDALYGEFKEAFDFEGVPEEQRPYHSLGELLAKTPDFWAKFVLPMFATETDSVHTYLSITGQPNPYLQAVEANIAEIRRRVQQGVVSV